MTKRIFDIVASSLGLILLAPLLILLALWVALDSRGGVFYRQPRVGRFGKEFRIYKLRTMHIHAEKQGLITIGDRDPRVTRAGYYLRKYKLDELPQFINVLIGEMSFVGPRPEVKRYVELYTSEQLKVLEVRPGITDAASIKYRNENERLGKVDHPDEYYTQVILPDKLALNLEYLKKQSLSYDIYLIVKTIFA